MMEVVVKTRAIRQSSSQTVTLQVTEKSDDLSIRFDTVLALDRQTDAQRDRIGKTVHDLHA